MTGFEAFEKVFFEIWGQFSFIGAVFLGSLLIAKPLVKKKNYWWLLSASILISSTIQVIIYLFFIKDKQFDGRRIVYTSLAFFLFISVIISILISYKTDFWAACFCATIGYSLQHISVRIISIIKLFVHLNAWLEMALLILVTGIVFYLAYYLIVKKILDKWKIIVQNKIQLIINSIIVMVAIYFNSFATSSATQVITKFYIYLFCIFICLLGIIGECGILLSKNVEFENEIIKRLMHDEKEHYTFEKSLIDEINMRCHDLKKIISLDVVGEDQKKLLEKLSDDIDEYEYVFKTNNVPLDVVLANMALNCQKNDIKFTCLADGTDLCFMDDIDVYFLFLNVIENAIDASKNVEKSKRLISLVVGSNGKKLNINIMNYHDNEINFQNNLPQTTKKEQKSHGFGMKSILLIVSKYQGTMKITDENKIFTVDINLPIKQKK